MPRYDGDCSGLAKYADPYDPFVKELVKAAAPGVHACSAGEYSAFADAVVAGAPGVQAAAQALYEQVLVRKPAIQFDRTPQWHDGAQQFRSAREIKEHRSANCLELALLFASCALQVRLEPVFLSVAGAEADHAFVGLWLTESGATRDQVREPDGSVAVEDIPDLLGEDRFADADDYWNGLSEAHMLVVDCSGAASGYPSSADGKALSFEEAVARAWELLTPTSSEIRCALDLAQARREMPFPAEDRPKVVGRKYDLDAVAAAAASRHVVVGGWLGVGKTALASQYAFDHQHEFPDGVFWLNAADEGRALEQLAAFAPDSDINSESVRGRGGDTPANVRLASRWAEQVNKTGSRALLIVDDVGDDSFITDPIEDLFTLSKLKCRLLITTRNINLLGDREDFETIVLSPLADEDAQGLLLSALPPDRRDEEAALRVCKQLTNVPLLVRIAGRMLAGEHAPTLREYGQKLMDEGFQQTEVSDLPPDYRPGNERLTSVLSRAWQGTPERAGGPREILKLLSVLPRNESVPFELLALMVSDPVPEDVRIGLVWIAAAELSNTGLAEQPEEGAIRIHPGVHEFAAKKADGDTGFVEQALQRAAVRLHEPDFYCTRDEKDLIRRGEQLRLLREPSERNAGLCDVVDLFDAQLDVLREGYDALAQLAMQARLVDRAGLAKVLEDVRRTRTDPWFRLRWHGRHERGHDPKAVGHSDAVSALAVWPKSGGETVPTVAVSASENGELIQWSSGPLRLKRRLADAGPPISGLCISPDGATVYASAWDGSLRTVALDGEDPPEAQVVGRHGYPANDCAVDPDGRFVVSVSDDQTARVYSLPEGTLLWALRHEEHARLLKCAVACRPQSREPILITASHVGAVRVWDPLTGKELADKLYISPGAAWEPVTACALAPGGGLAAVATRHKLLLWNPLTGDRTDLSTPEQYVTDCCFSPDGRRLMLVGRSKQVAVHEVHTRKLECHLRPWYHWLTACAFGTEGRLFYASDDGSVHLWKCDSPMRGSHGDEPIHGRPNWVNVFPAGDEFALSVSTDQTIYRWHLPSGQPERTIEGHANWLNAFAVSPDGEFVLSGTDFGEVFYWPLSNIDDKTPLKGHGGRSNACAISADGTIGLAASDEAFLRQWSLGGNFDERKRLPPGHLAAVTACAISADGKHALSGGDDARVLLWDLERGAIEKDFDGHEDRITATVFAHDQSDTVLSSSWDGTVKCWSIQSGQPLKDFREHTDGVTSCGSAAGGVAFSVSLDRTLRRWNLAGGGSDMRLHLGHRLRGLVVDPSGDMVLCSDMYGTVYLFDVMAGEGA